MSGLMRAEGRQNTDSVSTSTNQTWSGVAGTSIGVISTQSVCIFLTVTVYLLLIFHFLSNSTTNWIKRFIFSCVFMRWLTVVCQVAGQEVRRRPIAGFCRLYRHLYVLHPLLHLCEWTGEKNAQWIEVHHQSVITAGSHKLDPCWSKCSANDT